jgi:hypothetical protein
LPELNEWIEDPISEDGPMTSTVIAALHGSDVAVAVIERLLRCPVGLRQVGSACHFKRSGRV